MSEKYHKFYVPMDIWREIETQAETALGLNASGLARSYLVAGVYRAYAEIGETGGEKKKISTNKNIIKSVKKYKKVVVFNGEDFHVVAERKSPELFFKILSDIKIAGIRLRDMREAHKDLLNVVKNESDDDDIPKEELASSITTDAAERVHRRDTEWQKQTQDPRAQLCLKDLFYQYENEDPDTAEYGPY